jgi:glycosyltransferase involved in cell wall biosynthesis
VTPATLRVLHVGKFYPPAPGGMEKMVQLLCEGERPGVDSRVLVANTAARTTREHWRGVPVTRVASFGSIGSVGICPGFPLAMASAARDVTVLHEPNPVALVSDCVTLSRGPLVVWFHSEVVRPQWKYALLYRPFLRRVLSRASRIVVSSPRLAEYSRELADFRHKCAVIPFGLDTSHLAETPTLAARAADIARECPGPRVLFVGRLVPYKGVDVLIDAMATVGATCLIVGEGPLRASLESRAASAGVSKRVRFLGGVSDADLAAHLHACDLFVLPSVTRQETFGVVQLEAMACGRAVVSTNLETGVPWVNQHETTGLVVPPNDAVALAGAITRLLDDPALRARYGTAGRARVASEFSVEAMTRATTALYQDVVREAKLAEFGGGAAAAQSGADGSLQ